MRDPESTNEARSKQQDNTPTVATDAPIPPDGEHGMLASSGGSEGGLYTIEEGTVDSESSYSVETTTSEIDDDECK